jgi:hypothetical protein
MAKIKDESTPEGDANLPKRQRGDKPGGFGDKEIGSGGRRTTTDGRPVNGRSTDNDDGWHTSR